MDPPYTVGLNSRVVPVTIPEMSAVEPVWPDLAKFRHFGKLFKVLGNSGGIYLPFGKILELL